MPILVKRNASNASLLIWDAVLAIQRDCRAIAWRLSFVYKETVEASLVGCLSYAK